MIINVCLLIGTSLIAYFLIWRLFYYRNQLVALHEQMARNDAQLREQMHRLSEVQEAQDVSSVPDADTASLPSN